LSDLAYFNYAGLAPEASGFERHKVDHEFQRELFSEMGVELYLSLLKDCRDAIAKLLGVSVSDHISIVPNASFGLNLFINALQLKPGRVVITSDQEHPAVNMSLEYLRRIGVMIKTERKIAEQVERDQVALIVISHVSYKDGRILPVENIGRIAKRSGIPYIVDGAQAVGHISVDVESIQPSVYVFSGHKWLFGPMGTGGMFVERNFAEKHGGAWSSWASKPEAPYGSRFESGTMNLGLIAGLLEAVRHALSSREQRYHDLCVLGGEIMHRLSHNTSWTLVRWEGEHAPGILTYLLPDGIEPQRFTDDLLDHHGVVVKPFDPTEFDPQKQPNAVRISFWPWTREEEIRRLVEGIDKEISQYGPQAVRVKAATHSI
jgi:selenocysteine lyase/cysteine desulfurase